MQKENSHHKKVVLEKKADHVGIVGSYTKRELRKLLQSPVSVYQSDQKSDSTLGSTLRKGTTGLSQVDLDKMKEGKSNEISEEAARVSDDLKMKLTKRKTRLGKTRLGKNGLGKNGLGKNGLGKNGLGKNGLGKNGLGENGLRENGLGENGLGEKGLGEKGLGEKGLGEKGLGEKGLGEKGLGEEDDKEEKEEIKSFKDLLKERGLSESLIRALMENGLTDEYIRLLKALGFTDEDIAQLMAARQSGFGESASLLESEESCVSAPSSSDEYLSPESLYLKFYLSKVLPRALREIASKKPYDPIEYLGYWLLHSKICEEREKRRKDFEMELMIERERYRMANLVEEEMIPKPIEDGGEEDQEDWNFINYLNI